uniref:Uncharacterized protein n=1 Tax=Strombidium inclinatum TaxID=197538 RepID=A0A7S3MZ36_9SPIT|mmetsp:Transcript_24001/g.36872  ORF Transcript_24001/g.36872 Transcript_24001/m.36872 type:complete len:139 (+) Transcript_24001:652-1068(+)|eukprot:CAMPEP_0170496288 /NCGR_PEP_ID=MMETSP0208-20121228/20897_1 /TAXON_ID=197538 /ORGANISM="Strombidium inclinatum, Strain S3" /LENGTH=138 /DNA_ID=CAMNT_0010772791 /DNA_START=604 /DNA_END=1020 /DNA_ORIENTATION=-
MSIKKREYHPEVLVKVEGDEEARNMGSTSGIKIEDEISQECDLLPQYGNCSGGCSDGPGSKQTGIVALNFDDFFDLMQLKIQYQRKSISRAAEVEDSRVITTPRKSNTNVVVETRQESVSCFLWPSFGGNQTSSISVR